MVLGDEPKKKSTIPQVKKPPLPPSTIERNQRVRGTSYIRICTDD